MGNVQVVKVSDGLGFGEGDISFAAGRKAVDPALLAKVEALIRSAAIVVPVDPARDDDGCGDGRPAADGAFYHRPKVFGGGATMTLAALIGLGRAQGKPLGALFGEAMQTLVQHGLSFGGHTDDRAAARQSGCGAIDNAPRILAAAVRYKTNIAAVMESLGFGDAALGDIFAQFEQYVQHMPAESYSGQTVVDTMKPAQTIRPLTGEHREMYIILNTIRGRTVDQGAVREASGNRVQVFGVDVWRLQELAGQFEDAQASGRALLSELVYTLATAAVLTAGDLPVYLAKPEV